METGEESDPTHTAKEEIRGSQMALEVALEIVCNLRPIHGPDECNNETSSRQMKELHKLFSPRSFFGVLHCRTELSGEHPLPQSSS